ncbi:hypothetical protein BDV24DRAFT_163302 [Aspergillus arachidicola]|uniref:Uncharacterized protein n=1 Tax=Aspergillus arachidicola TaxID=656916 RepID=A0A5N6Y7R6_9EURO|nr:hypothetical protein BDV24DRAFT_163302 [Aspergillus arachidicola]
MFRKMIGREKVDEDILSKAKELTQLPQGDLKSIIRGLRKTDPAVGDDDYYAIFLKCEEEGSYRNKSKRSVTLSHLRCLIDIDRPNAERVLAHTVPPDNIIHALERLLAQRLITAEVAKAAAFRFVTGCGQNIASQHLRPGVSVIQMVTSARTAHHISDKVAIRAQNAYFLLLGPEEVSRIMRKEGIPEGESVSLFKAAEREGLGDVNVALMRQWKPITRDTIQDIIDKGYGHTFEEARNEYDARQLMWKHGVDRQDAKGALEKSNGDINKADQACKELADAARKNLQIPSVIPTRDTRSAPNVTKNTRVVAVLGVDEGLNDPNAASPSLGDGWMVSDFYLWLSVLDGMGKSQQWITGMDPAYLLERYGREDKVTMEDIEGDGSIFKPVQTKWAAGFIHGDPFEERKVVLDDALLPKIRDRVTIGPNGSALRDFFLNRLEETVKDAAQCGDRVLLMIFSHGDYDTDGGLLVGVSPFDNEEDIKNAVIRPEHIASILAQHPSVKLTIYMTSCYSGHWVETVEFQGRDLKPVILAAANRNEESFGFVWSHTQRHAGGLFSAATITELCKEPISLPQGASEDTSREYRKLTTEITAEMNRLCLPANITAFYGSSPVFSDRESQERFWRRTGYNLHDYRTNFGRLQTLPPSDPHPKRDRRRFIADSIDGTHPDILAWQQRHPGVVDEDYPEATGGYGATSRGLVAHRSMRYLINLYLKAKPRLEAPEHKALWGRWRMYNKGQLNHEQKVALRRELLACLQMNTMANQYAKILGLYKLSRIESWTVASTAQYYDRDTFGEYSDTIAHSRILHIELPNKLMVKYHRKPSQYLAASMLLAGYNKWDVQEAIAKLWRLRKSGKIMDQVSADYLHSIRYSKSVETIRALLGVKHTTQPRRSLADVNWR